MDQLEQLRTALADRYTIERELGGGGMSRVFLAREAGLGRQVVIKVLPTESGGAVSIDRFKREIQVAAQLQQANIVPLLAAGEVGGVPYYVMPYVEGESLRARLARDGELPIADVIGILREVARALSYAHEHGVVHRDIKPDNVLLSGGSAVVTDFGVAKALSASTQSEGSGAGLTSLGVALGTPAYMSPEQASADPHVDHRADIYALGAMAYELLTGQAPFAGRTPAAMLAAHVTESPEDVERRRKSVPPALAMIVRRCLEKRPADRPQSAAEVLRALDAVPTSSDATVPTAVRGRVRLSRPMISGLVVGLIAVSAATLFLLNRKSGQASGSVIHSIAVLPFENVGGDTATLYFSDGMRDELATALGKLPSLSVASRTSSYAFRGKNTSLADIGRELHVDAVLEGTVRRAGDQLRISAQLTRVQSGMGLWSNSYQRQMTDVFAVQEELAKAIAGALSTALDGSSKPATVSVASSRGTSNAEAYDLYLRGRYLWYARRDLPRAIEFFKQAVARDSTYAQAYAAMASTYVLLPYYSAMEPREGIKQARVAAARALALDGMSAEAHTALAFSYGMSFQWDDAEREFRRAIAADSTLANAYHWYGYVLTAQGRDAEAVKQYEKAVKLEPLVLVFQQNYAFSLVYVAPLERVRSVGQRMAELAANDELTTSVLAMIAARSGFPDSAARLIGGARGPLIREANPSGVFYLMLAGHRQQAESLAVQVERDVARSGRLSDLVAIYAALGDNDLMIAALNRALDKLDAALLGAQFVQSPAYGKARKDPRFVAALARMNLKVP